MRKHLLILLFFLVIGIFLSGGNYQFQVDIVQEGSWERIPVEFYAMSAENKQFIDATQTTTYGTITNGPPSGMGVDSDGPDGDTELLEASYQELSGWGNLDTETFGSSPTGWTLSYFSIVSGAAQSNTDTDLAMMTSEPFDISPYYIVRLACDYAAASGSYPLESGDWILQINTGAGYVTDYTFPARSETTFTTIPYQETVTSSAAVRWRWNPVGADAQEHIKIDNNVVDIQAYYTYYRFDAVFRFDNLNYNHSSFVLYVDFYTALTGSDDLDMFIETGDITPDAFQCANDKQNDFSVTVTDYITGDTVYLSIYDDYRSGDTSQTTAYIQRIYLYSAVFNALEPVQLYFDTPAWNVIIIVIICFYTELYIWAIDTFVIILGLVMIPTSTLYLVKGGRDELSSNKLFFFLVIFFVGWALLLGGIMP